MDCNNTENNSMDWEKIKIDIEQILEEVNDTDVKTFVNAMFAVVMDEEKVCAAIAKMIVFVIKNGSENEAVNNMFGFAKNRYNNSNDEKEWENIFLQMPEKEYLYFAADMKIKATVYLLRIHNFLKNGGLETKNIYETKEELEERIKNVKIKDVESFFSIELSKYKGTRLEEYKFEKNKGENKEEVKKYIELFKKYLNMKKNKTQETEAELAKIEAALAEIEQQQLDKNKEDKKNFSDVLPIFTRYQEIKNIKEKKGLGNDIKYYLFDNSMKEVEFVGIGWKWRWKYEEGEADFFRCYNGTNAYQYNHSIQDKGRNYYKTMLQSIVEHMNTGSNKRCMLASYSKDPYLDIYKYMSIKKEKGNYFFEVSKKENTEEIEVKFKYKENTEEELLSYLNKKHVTFAMVKKAKTNIVKSLHECEEGEEPDYVVRITEQKEYNGKCEKSEVSSFSEFVTSTENTENKIFCVDVLNNSVKQRGDVRDIFLLYMNQFLQDATGLQKNIVATRDKEVVMLGNTCDKVINVNIDSNIADDELENNTEYRVQLTGREIICLFQKISENANISGLKLVKEDNKMMVEKNGCTIEIQGMEKLNNTSDSDELKDNTTKKEEIETVEKKVQEAIENYFKELKMCNEKCDEKCNIKFIEKFIKNHTDKYNYKNATVYKKDEGDSFVNFCREIYMK